MNYHLNRAQIDLASSVFPKVADGDQDRLSETRNKIGRLLRAAAMVVVEVPNDRLLNLASHDLPQNRPEKAEPSSLTLTMSENLKMSFESGIAVETTAAFKESKDGKRMGDLLDLQGLLENARYVFVNVASDRLADLNSSGLEIEQHPGVVVG